MAKAARRGRYLTLDDVRVFYDKRTDTISLTAGDKDLETGGLKVDLSPGTQNERQLRELLKAKGVLNWNPWPSFSKEETFRMVVDSPEHLVHFGTNISGESAAWDTYLQKNFWVHGADGSKTGLFTRLAAQHAFVHGWQIYAIDPRGYESFQRLLRHPNTQSVATDSTEVLKTLRTVSVLIESRSARLRERGIWTMADIPPETRPAQVLLVIDSLRTVFENARADGNFSEVVELISEISYEGRLAGVRVLISSDSARAPEADFVNAMDELVNSFGHAVAGNYIKGYLPDALKESYDQSRGRGANRAQLIEPDRNLGPMEFEVSLIPLDPEEFAVRLAKARRGEW